MKQHLKVRTIIIAYPKISRVKQAKAQITDKVHFAESMANTQNILQTPSEKILQSFV